MRLSNGEALMLWPVTDHRITAGWYYSDGSLHRAIDFGVDTVPVYAAEDGTVDLVQVWNGNKSGNQSYGNMIRIKHADYRVKRLQTRYAHLSKIFVTVGETVTEGQLIGYSGNTGNSTGPHLHFEVILNGTRVNPLNWLDNDFYKAYEYVKLGTYVSIERPVIKSDNRLQILTLGPMGGTLAMIFWAQANKLSLGYKSEYADDTQETQILTIGPCSNGDALTIWTMAKQYEITYKSQYVED